MARSKYIYLVQDWKDEIIAAFTVKYEAIAFVNGRDLQLCRMLDGKESTPKLIFARTNDETYCID